MMQFGFLRKWWWLIPFVLLDIGLFLWMIGRPGAGSDDPAGGWGCACRRERPPVIEPPVKTEIPPMTVSFPTAQTHWLQTNDSSVFMPTESGRVQSALYGSVRTGSRGGRLGPAFHEGVDIAPLERDRRARALDGVRVVADGVVVYASRVGGNSSYGRYIIVEHADPVGPVYSLYAHLSAIEGAVRKGARVKRGEKIGTVGNSSTLGIPVSRAHLHLEVDLMLSRRFSGWCRQKKIKHPHGVYHGWNLTGIDPLALYPMAEEEQLFSMRDYLAGLRSAFEVVINVDRTLDYFGIYPSLWHGDGPPSGVMVLTVSHGGVILSGRPATEEEGRQLGKRTNAVVSVDLEELGRNGHGLISNRRGTWELTSKGRKWIEILTY